MPEITVLTAADGIWDTVQVNNCDVIVVFDGIFVPDIVIPNIIGLVGVVVTVSILEDTGIEPVNDVDNVPVKLVLAKVWDIDTVQVNNWVTIEVPGFILVPVIIIPDTIGFIGALLTVNNLDADGIEPIKDDVKLPVIGVLRLTAVDGAWDIS